jgi:hypothetical protein
VISYFYISAFFLCPISHHDIIARNATQGHPPPTPSSSRRSLSEDHDAEAEQDELRNDADAIPPVETESEELDEVRGIHDTIVPKDNGYASDTSEESDIDNSSNPSTSRRDGTLFHELERGCLS